MAEEMTSYKQMEFSGNGSVGFLPEEELPCQVDTKVGLHSCSQISDKTQKCDLSSNNRNTEESCVATPIKRSRTLLPPHISESSESDLERNAVKNAHRKRINVRRVISSVMEETASTDQASRRHPRPRCARNLFGPDESSRVDVNGNEILYQVAKHDRPESPAECLRSEEEEEELNLSRAEMVSSTESLVYIPVPCGGRVRIQNQYSSSSSDGESDDVDNCDFDSCDEDDVDNGKYKHNVETRVDDHSNVYNPLYNNTDRTCDCNSPRFCNVSTHAYCRSASSRRFNNQSSCYGSHLVLRPRMMFFNPDMLLSLDSVDLGFEEGDSEAELDQPLLLPNHYVAPRRQRRMPFRLAARNASLPVPRRLCFEN